MNLIKRFIMNRTIKTVALLTVLTLAATACQKENDMLPFKC